MPDTKRSFSQNRELAAAAGRKGGRACPTPSGPFPRTANSPPRPAAREVRPLTAPAPRLKHDEDKRHAATDREPAEKTFAARTGTADRNRKSGHPGH